MPEYWYSDYLLFDLLNVFELSVATQNAMVSGNCVSYHPLGSALPLASTLQKLLVALRKSQKSQVGASSTNGIMTSQPTPPPGEGLVDRWFPLK